MDLRAVKEMIHHDELRLPIILNHKRCAATDIIQIETAMRAGLECFNRPGLIEVSRDRFAPVKKLSGLFLLQSDVYSLNERLQHTLITLKDQNNIHDCHGLPFLQAFSRATSWKVDLLIQLVFPCCTPSR